MNVAINKLPGVLLAAALAIPAWVLGHYLPIIGSPVLGILFGMLLAFWKRPEKFNDGIRFSSKRLLQTSIILLGFGMSLPNILKVGHQTIALMLLTISTTLMIAYIVGKLLKIDQKTATLVGVGTSICGGSAIAATAPVINADNEEVAHSISTIFLFNVLAAFLFPPIGHLLGMSDSTFGLWAGTAVNDTSSVVAAGYSFSSVAGELAVIVKLTRTLMIIPISIILAVYTSRKAAGSNALKNYSFTKTFPWFVLGFLLTAIMNTWLPIPADIVDFLVLAGKFLIVMAMAAIGLNTRIVQLVRNGGKPIALGFICWLSLSLTSLLVQKLLFN